MSEFISTADAENQHTDDRRSRSAVPPIRATDGERLMRFWRHRDESAFAEVVELHAGLVWGVCSQVLRRREDVEDAFQATFLILARKAKSIRAADSAAGWLYRVAFRTALLARNRRLRMTEESLVHEPATDDDQLEAITRNEQCLVLLEELHALPTQYRQPLVLCYLEGRSRSEAADELGVTPQTVKGALARGTRMLRSRLVSRGAALSTTMAVMSASMVAAQAAAPPMLISHTAALGAGFALKLAGAGATATAVKGGAATVLAEKGILAMTIAAASKPAVAVLGVCLTAGMLAVATADAPKGGGEGGVDGGAAVVLLADSDADESPNSKGVSADVDAEFTANTNADAVANANADVDGESSNGNSNSNRGTITIASSDDPFAAQAAAVHVIPATPAVPVQPATAAISAPPTGFAISAATGWTPSEQPQAGLWRLASSGESQPAVSIVPPTISLVANESNFANRPHAPGASEASLKLEAEYWVIKGRALKKKADAIAAHAKAAAETGQQSTTETAAAEAEAELTLAEVKLCELNALRASEALEAVDAGKIKLGNKGPRVEALQQALNLQLKLSPKLELDGEFGGLTREAVIKFQKARGLKPDGVVDAAVAAALGEWDAAGSAGEIGSSKGIADKLKLQHAELQIRVREAETHAKQIEAKAKEAARAAIAAAQQSARQAEQASKTETREERIFAGDSPRILNPEALREMGEQLKELQKANEKLKEQLEELRESHDVRDRGW